MSSETWEIIRKLRGDEIELQIAFQCAPLITGLKESNLLNIEKQDYQRMKDIFKESELTIYPLGIHAGKITVFLYHPDRLEAFFSKESVQALLHEIGYTDTNLKQVLPVFRAHYQQYLREKKVFPHEFRNTGACLSPQNAFLNSIGLETLGLRMERICDNAMQLAAYIEENYKDITVNYAGLETSNWHEIAKSQFDGHYGGIFTLRLGSKERAFAFINALKYPLKVSNIGDTKTLVIHPESTISVHSTEEEKKAGGVFDDLVRVSVGIEDIDDLIWDFKQAIESLS